MSAEKYFTYRGDVRALAVHGGTVAFVTVHPEGRSTALHRLDADKLTLHADPLPVGAPCLVAASDGFFLGGTDRRLYFVPASGGEPRPLGSELPAVPTALAPVAGNRLAVAAGTQVVLADRTDGRQLQTLDLADAVTCLAADPTGQWLVVGTERGTVAVFECETDPATFRPSDAQPLHEAAVTALLFEADELRFLSTGADQKLLSTHARGQLEPEDRGRAFNHEKPVTALVAGAAERFLTGASDKSLKAWPKGKGTRPVTLKDGVGKVVALAVVTVHKKPQVVAACDDNSLRFFKLDDEGKFGDPGPLVHGVEAWAKRELQQGDPKRREATLRQLAEFDDLESLKRLVSQMGNDADHVLRLLACQLLGQSKHPRASKALEKGLEHQDEAVRLAAFDGMRRLAGPDDLRPLALALKAEKSDVGKRAVAALETLAPKDDQAMARLVKALEAKTAEVRQAALASLEKVHGTDSPEASLTALGTGHADLRRLALVRLYQRKLLHDPRVQAALRWRGDDPDPEVRRVAFLLSLYTRERLLEALRQGDPDLQRQLTELETGNLPPVAEQPKAKSAKKKAKPTEPTEPAPVPVASGESVVSTAAAQSLLARLPPALAARLQAQLEQLKLGTPGLMAQVLDQFRAIQAEATPAAETEEEEDEDE